MGFDGLFFGRADYEDYQTRNRTKTMEMVWKASANLGKWMRALFPFEHHSPIWSASQVTKAGYSLVFYLMDMVPQIHSVMICSAAIHLLWYLKTASIQSTSYRVCFRMTHDYTITMYQNVFKLLFEQLKTKFVEKIVSKRRIELV